MSSTYIANLAQVLAWAFTLMGVNIGVPDWVTTISTVVASLAGIWVFIGRWRAGGINIFGKRI